MGTEGRYDAGRFTRNPFWAVFHFTQLRLWIYTKT